MKIQCPECESSYRINPALIKPGTNRVKARCPRCNTVFSTQLPSASTDGAGLPAQPPVPPPPKPAPATVTSPSASLAANQVGAGTKRILVVDDSKFFRELILDVLKPLALDCLLAADGVEALEVMRETPPDLVMLDLNLPRMNGYELINAIRQDPALKSLPVLAMSGVFRKEADVARVVEAGADDFINKSFKPEQLQERVRKLLKGR